MSQTCRLKQFVQSSSDLLMISYSILFDEQQLAPPDRLEFTHRSPAVDEPLSVPRYKTVFVITATGGLV